MRVKSLLRRVAPCLALLAAVVAPARAQAYGEPTWPRYALGVGAGAFVPQGALADQASTNAAWELLLSLRPRGWRVLGVRVTGQFVEYGRSDTTYALPGVDVDTRTGSSLVWITLGPEVLIGSGPLRALGHAGIGLGSAMTQTSIRASTNDVGHTNHRDNAMAFEAGAALAWLPLRSGLLVVELGGRWVGTGALEHVPGSGIRRAAGELVLSPRRDELQGIVLRAALGVALDRWPRR